MLVVFFLVLVMVVMVVMLVVVMLHALCNLLLNSLNAVHHAQSIGNIGGRNNIADPLVGFAAVVNKQVAFADFDDILCGGVVAVTFRAGL